MKISRKIVLFLLMVCVALTGCVVSGCSKDKKSGEGHLEIQLFESGLGTEFLFNLKDAYLAKPENSAKTIKIKSSTDMGVFYNTIASGAKANGIDLYFGYGLKYRKYLQDGYLENMASILDEKCEGETKTISEKMDKRVKEAYKYEDGTYYQLPWMLQATGMTYNVGDFKKNPSWKLPRTSDELVKLFGQIAGTTNTSNNKKYIPCMINYNGYMDYLTSPFIAQYETIEGYNDFWEAGDPTGKGANRNVFKKQGRLEALKVMEKLIVPEGYVPADSETFVFTDSQLRYLAGETVMMPNGSWLESEMASEEYTPGDQDISIMPMPVLSAMVNAPDMISNINGNTKTLTEADLQAVIDVVDGVKDAEKPVDVSQHQFDRIKEARHMSLSTGFSMSTFIPSYSDAKDFSKDFMKFFYSDEGIQIYYDTVGYMPPVSFSDGRKIAEPSTTLLKRQNEMLKDVVYIANTNKNPLFYNTTVTEHFSKVPETRLRNVSPEEVKTAQEFFDSEWKLMCETDQIWKDWLTKAGGLDDVSK